MSRYARQIQLDALGSEGQQALEAAAVSVEGNGLAAQVCALYLIGAGVGTVEVSPDTASVCRGMNTGVHLVVGPDGPPRLRDGAIAITVHKTAGLACLDRITEGDPVAQGSTAARWAIREILR